MIYIILKRFFNLLNKIICFIIFKLSFMTIGKKSYIYFPNKVNLPKNVVLYDDVLIDKYSYLWMHKDAKLIIKSNTRIGSFFHVAAINDIVISEKVLIAERVLITDLNHSYNDIKIPIIDQGIEQLSKNKIFIGTGSWIGENVSILGASIGHHSIVGANSVVVDDVPDNTIVAGNPAKIIKYYDFNVNKWLKND